MRSMLPDDNDPAADAVAERLRAAADALSPTFSANLHARVMRVVGREAAVARPPVGRPRIRAAAGRMVAGVAAAAAVVLYAKRSALVPYPVPTPAPERTAAVAALPGLPPSPGQWVAMVDRIARRWVDGRRDEWDRTARRLGRFHLDQLDVFPTPAKSHDDGQPS